MSDCGQVPPGQRHPVCMLPEGHDGRHESEGHWWHDRQQTPVRFGHIHSDELICTSVCPGYRRSTE